MRQSRLQPFSGMLLQLMGTFFEFMPHPFFPNDRDSVFVLEGGTAFIYKIRNVDTKELCALKVFKRDSRNEHIARVAAHLARYTDLPELRSEQRVCLTKKNYPAYLYLSRAGVRYSDALDQYANVGRGPAQSPRQRVLYA